jgi:hypothetical protein
MSRDEDFIEIEIGRPTNTNSESPAKSSHKRGNSHDAAPPPVDVSPEGVSIGDFSAYMPDHNYIYKPTRKPWPAQASTRVPPVLLVDKNGDAP